MWVDDAGVNEASPSAPATSHSETETRGVLNLEAIADSLASVQRDFARINRRLSDPRDPLTDTVLANMLAGYRRVEALLSRDESLFGLGHSDRLLELNRIVLCGEHVADSECHQQHLEASARRFYDDPGGGVKAFMEWWQLHQNETVWRQAAGVFIQTLSEPQLFIEGNHRTGVLFMSYLLGRAGHPPFVLSVDNARMFFEPASLTKKTRKHGLQAWYRVPKLTKRFAQLLQEQANPRYLESSRG